MYNVYFETSKGTFKKLGEARYHTAAIAIMQDFLKMHNFKSYYWNVHVGEYKGKKATVIDVGSHTEFFYITPPIEKVVNNDEQQVSN